MKPYKIALFCFCIIGLLASLCAAFPAEGIQIGNLTLNFPTLNEVLKTKQTETPKESPEELLARRLKEMRMNENAQYQKFFTENPARIHFPNDNVALFDDLFAALDNAKRKPVRILHYGDSQIEEDRITNMVRNEFQERFGGGGVGLVPLIQTIPSQTISQSTSISLPRRMVFGDATMRTSNRLYGPMGQTCIVDTVVSCRFSARGSKAERTSAHYFSQLTLLVGNIQGGFTANVKGQKQELTPSDKKIQMMRFTLPDSTSSVSLTLSGYANVYGVMLDNPKGVSIDNIPMRGCSGTIFTDIDPTVLSTYYKQTNVQLIILEFGGNSIPYLKTETSILKYKASIIRQIAYLKRLAPQAQFLFIGPSDMTTRVKGTMQTYPMLPTVVQALREAAFESGAAYWDLYEVMGGHNSMINWVKSTPPLANNDYVHFSRLGAEKVGDMLYKSLMLYYDYYKWRQKDNVQLAIRTDEAE